MFTLTSTLLGAVAGMLATVLWYMVKELQASHHRMQETLYRDYVRKDDYREDVKELKEMLQHVVDKLDKKADKQ